MKKLGENRVSFSVGFPLLIFVIIMGTLGCGRHKDQSSTQAAQQTVPQTISPIRVELSWDEPTNLNLELWDGEGMNYLHPVSQIGSPDVKVGGEGAEYLEFKKTQNEFNLDLSTGMWSVFVGHPYGYGSVKATVTITFPNGASRRIHRVIPGEAYHWEVCTVSPADQRVEEVDRMYYTNRY